MRTPLPLSLAALATAGLLAGCTQATYPSAPFTTPSAATPPSTSTPTATPTVTPTWTGDAAKIADALNGYMDFLSRAYADPAVSVTDSAKYLSDVPPDYVMTAVERQILKFRQDGNKETGTGSNRITSIEPNKDGTYTARACDDYSNVTVTDAKGRKVDTGPTRSAVVNTLTKGVDGVWRISKIQGVGTC
jgi:hypothetical protein